MAEERIRYVALGDSYTAGEGVSREEAWPSLLTYDLQRHGVPIDLIANVAKTGWLTQHVLELELPVFSEYQPTFATLLIGTNDWVQEVRNDVFAKNLQQILDAMQKILPDPKKILLLTTPDFSVTQVGQIFASGRDITVGVEGFNSVIKNEAKKRMLPVVDIFPLSSGMKDDPALVALDGLHPSAKEYVLWEKEIFPEALKLLQRN